MFHRIFGVAACCLLMVPAAWGQVNSAQIRVHPATNTNPSPYDTTVSIGDSHPHANGGPVADNCCGQRSFFGRGGGRMWTRGNSCCETAGCETQAVAEGCQDGCCQPRQRRSLFACCPDECCNPCRYLAIHGGWVHLQDLSGTNPQGVPFNATFNDGWGVGFASGRYLNPCVRVEMEGTYRNHSGNTFTLGTVPPVPMDGHINNWASMFNVYRDFRNGGDITPYVGAGAGFGYTDAEFDIGGTTYVIDDWAFAYQGIVGLSHRTGKCHDVFVEYRFYGNTEVEMEPVGGGAPLDFNYLSHNVFFGIRINR